MNRSEFLRTGLLALVATGIGINTTKQVEVVKIKHKIHRYAEFKITEEALKDQHYFACLLDDHKVCGTILSYEIGLQDDDFIYDLMTVRITYI